MWKNPMRTKINQWYFLEDPKNILSMIRRGHGIFSIPFSNNSDAFPIVSSCLNNYITFLIGPRKRTNIIMKWSRSLIGSMSYNRR